MVAATVLGAGSVVATRKKKGKAAKRRKRSGVKRGRGPTPPPIDTAKPPQAANDDRSIGQGIEFESGHPVPPPAPEQPKQPDELETELTAILESLEPLQRAFVEEYPIDLHGAQAAIRAGYSEKGAAQTASRLFTNVNISRAIEIQLEQRSKRTQITQDRVLLEMAEIGFSDIDHYRVDRDGNVTLKDGAPRRAMRAVASVKRKVTVNNFGESTEVEIRLWDKPGTLKMMREHLKMDPPKKLEVTGKDGKPLAVDAKVGLSKEASDQMKRDILGLKPKK